MTEREFERFDGDHPDKEVANFLYGDHFAISCLHNQFETKGIVIHIPTQVILRSRKISVVNNCITLLNNSEHWRIFY